MSLYELQKQVDDWTSQFKPQYWKPHEIMVRLMEEVGELAREVNHLYGPKPKKSTEGTRNLLDEIGDMQFTLICLANSIRQGDSSQMGNLDEAWKRVMDKCYGRDKDRFEKK